MHHQVLHPRLFLSSNLGTGYVDGEKVVTLAGKDMGKKAQPSRSSDTFFSNFFYNIHVLSIIRHI